MQSVAHNRTSRCSDEARNTTDAGVGGPNTFPSSRVHGANLRLRSVAVPRPGRANRIDGYKEFMSSLVQRETSDELARLDGADQLAGECVNDAHAVWIRYSVIDEKPMSLFVQQQLNPSFPQVQRHPAKNCPRSIRKHHKRTATTTGTSSRHEHMVGERACSKHQRLHTDMDGLASRNAGNGGRLSTIQLPCCG